MPNNLKELYDHIGKECDADNLSLAQFLYSVGWIFYDVFERADHEAKKGSAVGSSDIDRFVREIPESRISRDIADAQQNFGRAAADFMEDEIQIRIRSAIDSSIVTTVQANTSGLKVFALNVSAGVVAGIIFALITVGGYFFVKVDPSVNAAAKEIAESKVSSAIIPPAAPLSSPIRPK